MRRVSNAFMVFMCVVGAPSYAQNTPAPTQPAAAQPGAASPTQAPAAEEPAFKQEELEQILAPIALYPDSLLSQILMASTYPVEVVEADRWAKKNAKLKGEGGEYRVRYIVDEEEMRWIDRWEDVVLSNWVPGKHTIRMELVGPDGWPYRNGDYNIIDRELTVVK